jgi:hypothetical protein
MAVAMLEVYCIGSGFTSSDGELTIKSIYHLMLKKNIIRMLHSLSRNLT